MQTDENFKDFLPIDENAKKYVELNMMRWSADDKRYL